MATPARSDDRRAKMRMDQKVIQHTVEHGAFGGGATLVVPPNGVKLWEPDKADTYYLRICPYPVTKAGHPDGVKPGDWHYRHPYGIHWNVGSTGNAVICLRDTFRQSDRICDRMQELRAEGYEDHKEAIDAAQSKRNCLFPVIDVKNNPKEVMIFDWSYSKFAKELEKKLKSISKIEFRDFAQADGGWILKVLVVTDLFNGKKFFKVLEGDNFGGACPGIEFIDAQKFKVLDDKIIDQLERIKLDDCFVVTPAKEIAAMFDGGNVEGGEAPAEGGTTDGFVELEGSEAAPDTTGEALAEETPAEETPAEEAPAEDTGFEEPVAEEPTFDADPEAPAEETPTEPKEVPEPPKKPAPAKPATVPNKAPVKPPTAPAKPAAAKPATAPAKPAKVPEKVPAKPAAAPAKPATGKATPKKPDFDANSW